MLQQQTVAGHKVGPTGYGLMGFTWRPDASVPYVSDEEAFKAMKTALEHGDTFWNSGDFYGETDRLANLKLLRRYFDKYPEDAPKVFLSVKGGMNPKILAPDGTAEAIATTVNHVKEILGDAKKFDMFTLARVGNVPIEESVKAIDAHIKNGDFDSYCLSEVAAQTIRRAHKIRPVDAVEIEVSLWSREAEENGVMATCKELGIPVIAYSPVGRGFLTGRYKSKDQVPTVGILDHMDRFKGDAFDANLRVVHKTEEIAKRKNCTPAQVALSWLRDLSNDATHPVIIPIPGSTNAKRVAENSTHIDLGSDADDLNTFLASFKAVGSRYSAAAEKLLYR